MGWGDYVCARVQARKESQGRNPSRKKIDEVLKSGRGKNTTPEDLRAAFDSGKEVRSTMINFFFYLCFWNDRDLLFGL